MGLFSKVVKRVKKRVPRRPTPPMSIGGVGGRDRPINISGGVRSLPLRPQPTSMLPIMPPSMPSLNLPNYSALRNISPAIQKSVQESLATGKPLLSP